MDECLSQFGVAMPSKKFAKEHGIKYWKKFDCQKKMVELYSSSGESDEENEETAGEEAVEETKEVCGLVMLNLVCTTHTSYTSCNVYSASVYCSVLR